MESEEMINKEQKKKNPGFLSHFCYFPLLPFYPNLHHSVIQLRECAVLSLVSSFLFYPIMPQETFALAK